MQTQNRLNEVLGKLKNHNLRLTPQRLAVLNALVSNPAHPTVEEVYAAVKTEFPMTSLATVYKTITMLKEIDEVTELHYDNLGNRYDGVTGAPHPHLVCTQCRRIFDAELISWEQIAQQLQKKSGFQIAAYRMDIFGVCPECQAKNLSA